MRSYRPPMPPNQSEGVRTAPAPPPRAAPRSRPRPGARRARCPCPPPAPRAVRPAASRRMHPEPVPRSSTRGERLRQRQRHQRLGLGPGVEHVARHAEVAPPEGAPARELATGSRAARARHQRRRTRPPPPPASGPPIRPVSTSGATPSAWARSRRASRAAPSTPAACQPRRRRRAAPPAARHTLRLGELRRLVVGHQRVDHLVEVAREDLGQPVERQPDPVVGQPPLREVVGADALGPVARAHLALPRRRALGVGLRRSMS